MNLWIGELFESDPSISSKFHEQEINGLTLMSERILTEDNLNLLGLRTIGKKAKFTGAIEELKGTYDFAFIRGYRGQGGMERNARTLLAVLLMYFR